MRIELTRVGLLVYLANHYTTRGAPVLSAEPIEYTDCISAERKDHPNECPGYDTEQSNDKASVVLKLWGMQNTPLLPSPPGPHWSGVVASNKVLSTSPLELFDHLTVCKQKSDVQLNCY